MNINYLQIAIGILIGIALCIQFPNLPNQLKQIAKNFKKAQEKEAKEEEKPKAIIQPNNNISMAYYSQEFPENFYKELGEEKLK